jgi:hypothetical protein
MHKTAWKTVKQYRETMYPAFGGKCTADLEVELAKVLPDWLNLLQDHKIGGSALVRYTDGARKSDIASYREHELALVRT